MHRFTKRNYFGIKQSVIELENWDYKAISKVKSAKTRAFLSEHQDNPVIYKLRMNIALTSSDLEELEKILSESGVGRKEDIVRAKAVSHGLGLFVRSLVGWTEKLLNNLWLLFYQVKH
jgi:type I site-specific restriction endonuclease